MTSATTERPHSSCLSRSVGILILSTRFPSLLTAMQYIAPFRSLLFVRLFPRKH